MTDIVKLLENDIRNCMHNDWTIYLSLSTYDSKRITLEYSAGGMMRVMVRSQEELYLGASPKDAIAVFIDNLNGSSFKTLENMLV